jgi:molecular chaperone HtpG
LPPNIGSQTTVENQKNSFAELPHQLFSSLWGRLEGKLSLNWPFPMLTVVDNCGKRDLDLNSPRTEIVMSEKWVYFEETLAFEICLKIADSVEPSILAGLKESFDLMFKK